MHQPWAQIQKYVDEELAETFGRLILFVKQTQEAMGVSEDAGGSGNGSGSGSGAGSGAGAGAGAGAGGGAAPRSSGITGKPQVDPAVVEALVMDFEANWKAGIEKINARWARVPRGVGRRLT